MGYSKGGRLPTGDIRVNNKSKRQQLWIERKRDDNKRARDRRFSRKAEEDRDPSRREQRLAKNPTKTIDDKRVWDDFDDDSLGVRVDVARLKRRRLEEAEATQRQQLTTENEPCGPGSDAAAAVANDDDGDNDSMLDSDEEEDGKDLARGHVAMEDSREKPSTRESSAAPSEAPSVASSLPSSSTTQTNLDLTPSSFALNFPTLFVDGPLPVPKILITTSLNSTLHEEANILTALFPNAAYVRRTRHRHSYKYSLREICGFAHNRNYTAVVMLKEDQKKPTGLVISCLPSGPTLSFSISNWIEGRRIAGHGNGTNHYPELLLNNFRTPLGLLSARLFMTLFPPQPEFQGRQVVTMHNQRDYIFVRRHRYIFRDKRPTERNVVGTDGKDMEGVKGIRAGLQELGPRFTLKLRRVDKGIGRAGSGGDDAVQWEWRGKSDKNRKAFNL